MWSDFAQLVFGIRLIEAQRAETNFRPWRFYPGPPLLEGLNESSSLKGERGQALAETALFAMLAVIMAFGL
ncbi:hypothetical protein [Candidatus Villigracilis affinis]|uniref:hypothetical protein n=1 Tax=Candidatus Villigracilis affinis TaxID=3140682 RepID=UPI002A1BDF2C|nr:hypothetical protein [Anaerolineales bacterium]